MERGIKGLSNDLSCIYVGLKSKKLLRVEVDSLGYFEDLSAQVAIRFHLLARVTVSVKLRFRLLELF